MVNTMANCSINPLLCCQGGVRGTGVLWSPLLTRTGRVTKQLMHISDWLPTFLAAADASPTGNTTTNFNIDGINLWHALKDDKESPRKSILHNIDDIYGNAAITMGDFKLLKGRFYHYYAAFFLTEM